MYDQPGPTISLSLSSFPLITVVLIGGPMSLPRSTINNDQYDLGGAGRTRTIPSSTSIDAPTPPTLATGNMGPVIPSTVGRNAGRYRAQISSKTLEIGLIAGIDRPLDRLVSNLYSTGYAFGPSGYHFLPVKHPKHDQSL
jgi:hypothetical protein